MTPKFDRAIATFALSFITVLAAGVTTSMAQMPPTIVTTMKIAPETITVTDELPGRVSALRTAEIRPQVGGIVEKRFFEQGAKVEQGQPLFQIFAAPFKAEVDSAKAALSRAEASLTLANTKLERSKQLRAKNSISQQEYDSAVSEAKSAEASVEEARAVLHRQEISFDFTTIRSPISGQIGASLISEGTLVSVGQSQALAVVQQIDEVYVDLRRPASGLARIQQVAGEHSDEPTIGILDVEGKPFPQKGKALFTDISVDESTGDVTMRVLVDNPNHRLLPGMFVRAVVPRETIKDALLVPQQAIIRDTQGGAQLVVVGSDNVANIDQVTLGELEQGRYIVTSGLEPNATVAIRGHTRVTKDGTTVQAMPAAQPQQ